MQGKRRASKFHERHFITEKPKDCSDQRTSELHTPPLGVGLGRSRIIFPPGYVWPHQRKCRNRISLHLHCLTVRTTQVCFADIAYKSAYEYCSWVEWVPWLLPLALICFIPFWDRIKRKTGSFVKNGCHWQIRLL